VTNEADPRSGGEFRVEGVQGRHRCAQRPDDVGSHGRIEGGERGRGLDVVEGRPVEDVHESCDGDGNELHFRITQLRAGAFGERRCEGCREVDNAINSLSTVSR